MRSLKQLTTDLIKKPPILFPLVGLFHILWLLWTIWDDRSVPFPSIAWLEVVWMAGYITFWLAICDMRKWGALGYILLTIVNTSLYLAIRQHKIPQDYMSNMFELDALFSFFALFYYKRLE